MIALRGYSFGGMMKPYMYIFIGVVGYGVLSLYTNYTRTQDVYISSEPFPCDDKETMEWEEPYGWCE